MRSSHAHAPAFLDPGAREEGGLAEDAEGALAVEACVDAVTGCRGLLAMLGQGGAATHLAERAGLVKVLVLGLAGLELVGERRGELSEHPAHSLG